MKSLVIYHGNCADGFGAAYVAWKALDDSAEYVPANYGDCVISDGNIKIKDTVYELSGRKVYVLDYSIPPEQMSNLIDSAKLVFWLDHHKSAIDAWLGPKYLAPHRQSYMGGDDKLFTHLNNQKAGCRLAWEYFFPDIQTPMGLQYIEDRDLWRFNMANTKPFCEGLNQEPHDFASWDPFMVDNSRHDELVHRGKVLLEAKELRAKKVAGRELIQVLLGGEIFHCANVVNDISETGTEICKATGRPSATFFISDEGNVVVSLRSLDGIPVDVAAVALQYGGGGHRNAAGFKMGIYKFFSGVYRHGE
jgi:uncharacterized protein